MRTLRYDGRLSPWPKAWRWALCFIVITSILSCSELDGGLIVDHASFVDALKREGYIVDVAGEVEQPFLSVKGTMLRLRGASLSQPAEVQSYNYESASAAKSEASKIGPDGNPKGSQIFWVEPPHFYIRERVLVVYVGSEPQVTGLLTRLFGPQFAGR